VCLIAKTCSTCKGLHPLCLQQVHQLLKRAHRTTITRTLICIWRPCPQLESHSFHLQLERECAERVQQLEAQLAAAKAEVEEAQKDAAAFAQDLADHLSRQPASSGGGGPSPADRAALKQVPGQCRTRGTSCTLVVLAWLEAAPLSAALGIGRSTAHCAVFAVRHIHEHRQTASQMPLCWKRRPRQRRPPRGRRSSG
jgi:hypothetical protein